MNWPFQNLRRPTRAPLNVGPLAVGDSEPWWLAVHSIIDLAEWETIDGARRRTKDTNACIAAIGAGEGVALVRQKLIEARELALKEMKGGR
jgi:hypothetical protein